MSKYLRTDYGDEIEALCIKYIEGYVPTVYAVATGEWAEDNTKDVIKAPAPIIPTVFSNMLLTSTGE